ncbi:MAG: hypothetical protein EOP00_36540 [Pedobacter sp.]|nr:MAG: hypothetical protein EOP00_36540 [Pedobacter sp.]
MHWRKANILIHRYLSYYFFGLTAVYAISGFAVNHIEDWNPNYIINKKSVEISQLKDSENISLSAWYYRSGIYYSTLVST